jgi:hypothetical protein
MDTTAAHFEHLTEQEVSLLAKSPVLISVLAAGGDDEFSQYERAEVIKQAHLKTYTGDPVLHPFYNRVGEDFEANYNEVLIRYIPFTAETRAALKEEIRKINVIVNKLDVSFARALRLSLADYARHAKYADKKFVENYLFPFAQ